MARIVLQDVTKRFGKDVVAVDRVSMEIADGEFMVLVGPSGCGKTTLLRIIAGLEEVSDGEVVIGEQIVTDLAPKHRDIAMVFQNYALYPHMTVAQNMAFGLRCASGRRPRSQRRSTPPRGCSASSACSNASPRSYPAASASGSRWGGRWCASRGRS